MNPTQEHMDKAIEIRKRIIDLSRAIEEMGVDSADLRHSIIKLGSAERGLEWFLDKAEKGEVE